MFLSKIEINPLRLNDVIKQLRRGLYSEHQMIWNLFPYDANISRDFLYRREDSDALPFYYILSERKPNPQTDYFNIAIQSFDPKLRAGDRLHFNLRANAVISRRVDDGSNRRVRRDIVEAKIDEYRQQEPDSAKWPPKTYIYHEAGQTWLKKQSEKHGFEVEVLYVQNHQYYAFKKTGNNRDKNKRQFSSSDFTGTLTVTDPKLFRMLLFTGLGRAKAYGCGLLLVKRHAS